MIVKGRIVYFNDTQYREKGYSYAFANSPDSDRQIFLGTFYRVYPEIQLDQVTMGRNQNPGPLSVGTSLKGREVVIETREVKKGLGGYWCFLEEWELAEGILEVEKEARERRRVEAEEAERQYQERQKRLAEQRQRETEENPRNIDEALAHGWKIVAGGNGRQRILERQFPEEARPRRITRHLPPQPSSRTIRRFAMAS